MTHAETRTVGYAIAGSLAVHVLLAVAFALWIGLASFHRLPAPPPTPTQDEEPEVTLVFPDLKPPEPVEPQKKEEQYIRTTQNTETAKPEKADFISDKNTVAMARVAPAPDGTKPMPNMQGVDYATNELANRTYRNGETKNDSTTAPPKLSPAVAVMTPPSPKPQPQPPTPPPVSPQMKLPEPAPQPAPTQQPVIAKKQDAPAETMMKELDAALAKQPPQDKPSETKPKDQPPEMIKPPEETREALPLMRTPEEKAVPPAIPMATPIINTPRAEKNAFQPETHRSATKGTISNIGNEDAVNAMATPSGRYERLVQGAIEKKWHQFLRDRMDAVEPGKLGMRFYVNRKGKIEHFEFTFKEANVLIEDFTLEAVFKAEIPPMPAELVTERMLIEYNVVIHP